MINLFRRVEMRKNEMGEIARTDKARYSAIRRVLKSELEDINTNYIKLIEGTEDGIKCFEVSGESTSEFKHYIREALRSLPEREGFILEKRFIFGYTLEEVGEMMNLSRDRIRQIQERGLQRLRGGRWRKKHNISHILHDFWDESTDYSRVLN